MFKSKKEDKEIQEEPRVIPQPPENKTLIGLGLSIETALIKGKGNLTIDGEVTGDIKLDGNIVVGATGFVKGNIEANHILLSGRLEGNITSKSSVHLTSKANLTGDIEAAGLVIDEGAVFSGKCNMTADNSKKNNLTYNTDETEQIEDTKTEEEKDPNLSFDK